jgi:hypothetical protein
MSDEDWGILRTSAARLLAARSQKTASEMIVSLPFEVWEGTNYFQDEFSVLRLVVSVERYVQMEEEAKSKEVRLAYNQIANTVMELGTYIRFIVAELSEDENLPPVKAPSLQITSAIVERALADAEELIRDRGAVSGLDRVHTAFHGYLKVACDSASLPIAPDASITVLFKVLREHHPALAVTANPATKEIDKILRTLSSVVDALNPLRNRSSVAHPNNQLLDEAEAMLTINAVRTMLHYLDLRLRK